MDPRPQPRTFWHRTDEEAAVAILATGFRDGCANYMTSNQYVGVWIADRPIDENEGAFGSHLLRVELDGLDISGYEWIEECKGFREWLVPAALLNAHSAIALDDVRPDMPEEFTNPTP